MLNLTSGTIVLFLASIPEFIALVISLNGYLTKKYSHLFYMSLTWLFMFIGTFFLAISYLNIDTTLYRLAILANAPLTFSIMFLVDSISRQSIDNRKLFITTLVSTSLIIFSFDNNAVKINQSFLDESSPSMAGNFDFAGSVLFFLASLYWLYYMTKIYLNSPQSIKKDSMINLIGAIIAGPGAALVFATGFVWILPCTDYICIAIGALMCSYAFKKQPKLGYVLPFKVYRLMTIDTGSGISLYAYEWEKENILDNQLFSASLIGISSILNESLSKGVIKEIIFEKGILLIQHYDDYPVFFVLVANESRPILEKALDLFSNDFMEKFPLEELHKSVEISKYKQADDIVKDTFPFVVEYL